MSLQVIKKVNRSWETKYNREGGNCKWGI